MGTRWKCIRCYEFNICSACYHSASHSLEHCFNRFDAPRSVPRTWYWGYVIMMSLYLWLQAAMPSVCPLPGEAARGAGHLPHGRGGAGRGLEWRWVCPGLMSVVWRKEVWFHVTLYCR